MAVQYTDLTCKQKEIANMIVEDCKKKIEKLTTEFEIKTVNTYIVEIKLEDSLV